MGFNSAFKELIAWVLIIWFIYETEFGFSQVIYL